MINEKKNFYWPVKDNLRTCDSIWKIATGQRDDDTTGCCWTMVISKSIIKW